MMRTYSILAGTILALATGCTVVGVRPHFDAHGFASNGFRVDYVDPARYRFLSDDWRVDNYKLDEQTELPLGATGRHADTQLVLQHRRTHAELWVESHAITPAIERTELRVLAERWVGAIANEGYFQAKIVPSGNGGGGSVTVRTRRFAATLLEGRDISLAGKPAYAALVDVANLNQAEIDPNERTARVLVVFARMPYAQHVEEGRAVGSTPLLLIAGYSNLPADFDASEDDFERFLASIVYVSETDGSHTQGSAAR